MHDLTYYQDFYIIQLYPYTQKPRVISELARIYYFIYCIALYIGFYFHSIKIQVVIET